MPKCGCANDQCSCTIIQGDGVSVAGAGTQNNPYVISQIPVLAGPAVSGRFSGEIVPYAGSAPPAGWLVCDGSAVNRLVYAALFAIIGITYGAGNGTDTFNLPNLVGKFPLGADGGHARGTSGGAAKLTAAMLPSHTHPMSHTHPDATTVSGGAHDHQAGRSPTDGTSFSTYRTGSGTDKTVARDLIISDGAHTHLVSTPQFSGSTGAAGSTTPSDSLPPYTAITYLIKF